MSSPRIENGYLHVSSSPILPLLTKTRVLCSINTLLCKYGLAPMSGELNTKNALNGVLNESETAFVKISELFTNSQFPYSVLIQDYGTATFKKPIPLSAEVIEERLISTIADDEYLTGYKNLLIELLGQKQYGNFPQLTLKAISHVQSDLSAKLEIVKNRFFKNYLYARFIRCFGVSKSDCVELINKYFEPYISKEEVVKFEKEILAGIPTEKSEFTLNWFLEKLKLNQEGFEKIYKKIKINDFFLKPYDEKAEPDNLSYSIELSIRFPYRDDLIAGVLKEPNFEPDYLLVQQKQAFKELSDLSHLTTQVCSLDAEHNFVIPPNQRHYLEEQFPIAFVTTADEKLQVSKNEYKAKVPLDLSKDIQWIILPANKIAMVKKDFDDLFDPSKIISFDEFEKRIGYQKQKFDGVSRGSITPQTFFSLQPKLPVDEQNQSLKPKNSYFWGLIHG